MNRKGGVTAVRIASRKRGAWIETKIDGQGSEKSMASPPGNGGRGLKLARGLRGNPHVEHRLPETGGVD